MTTLGSPQAATELTAGERTFVEDVASHYHRAHGVPLDSGRILGWLMICDPPRQRIDQACAALGVEQAEVEPFVEQMTLAEVFARTDDPDTGSYSVRMLDDGWPKAVAHTFASWPAYHEVMRFGLEVLADAPQQRRLRLAELERLFRYLVTELPDIIERYRRSEGEARS